MYTGRILSTAEVSDYDRVVTNGDGTELDVEASLRVVNHSPTGFCWGYQGSGPAQLALAILLDHFNGDRGRALALYQDFKSKVIARLDMDSDFVLTDEQVENAITAIDVERMQRA